MGDLEGFVNMKTLKIILAAFGAAILLIAMLIFVIIFIMAKKYGGSSSASYDNGDVYIDRAEDITGLDLDHGKVARLNDTKGGFFGEGDVLLELQYSDEDHKNIEDQIPAQKHWQELPMEKELTDRLMGFDFEFPQSGYYLFYDRHKEAKSHYDYKEIKKRHSIDFSVIILDNDTQKLVYIERDT